MSGIKDWSGPQSFFGKSFVRRTLSILMVAGAAYISYRAARYFLSSRSRKAAASAAADADAADSSSGRARRPRVSVSLDDAFTAASEYVRRRPVAADETDLLELYALYKMATVGRCTAPKPSAFDFQRVAMWTAWSNLREIPQDDAKRAYLEALSVLLPRWQHGARVRFPGRCFGGPPTEGEEPSSAENPAPGADTDDEDSGSSGAGAGDDADDDEPFAPVDYDVFEEAIAEAERLDAARGAAYGEENATGEKPGRGRMGPVFSGGFSLEDDIPAALPAEPTEPATKAEPQFPAPDSTPAHVSAVASAPSLALAAASAAGAGSSLSIATHHAPASESGSTGSTSDMSADMMDDALAPAASDAIAPLPATLHARALVRSEAGDRDDDAAFEEARSVSSSAATATASAAPTAGPSKPARGVPGSGDSDEMRTLVSGGGPALDKHFASFGSSSEAAKAAVEVDERGRSLLHHAADACDSSSVVAVLAAISNGPGGAAAASSAARAPDVEGLSPLHYAVFSGEGEAVSALVAAGADATGGSRMDPRGPFARMAAGAFELDAAALNGSDGKGLTARECAELIDDESVLAALGQ